MKAKFHCLLAATELYYAPEEAAQILNVCCTLHNICLEYKIEQFSVENIGDDIFVCPSSFSAETENTNFSIIMKTIRDEIKNNMRRD